ncbi:uncharacterized protein LOC110446891 [Mizuhopecten yessoensis]|uniref:uncharacterized protein LOC110446891 n=1 Tax=Mizuhopecten yessoensis TaxID=6573 RepID=UPI000B45EF70|nr:uncharacterized protein LOC110446891 [Mizuhopecten yessoensis]
MRSRSPSPTNSPLSRSPQHDVKITRTNRTEKSIIVPITVNGTTTEAVIDTGADATVISEKWANEINLLYTKPKKDIRLMTAEDGAEMTGLGVVTATLQIGEEVRELPVVIAPIRDNILVGIDLLQSVQTIIHTGEKNLEVNGKVIPGHSQLNRSGSVFARSIFRVHADVVVPPGSEKIIIGRFETPSDTSQEILEAFNHHSGMRVGSCLVSMNQTIPVRALNMKDSEIKLTNCTFLGKVEDSDLAWDSNMSREPSVNTSVEPEHLQEAPGRNREVPLHVKDSFEESSKGLSSNQKEDLCMLLNDIPDIFAKDDYDLGRFSGVRHKIDTGENKPIRQPARRTPLGFQAEKDANLQNLWTLVLSFHLVPNEHYQLYLFARKMVACVGA